MIRGVGPRPRRRRLARLKVRLLEHGRGARLPEQALEVLARLTDGEDPLVRRVEGLFYRAHVLVRLEPRRYGHVQLPHLRAIAGLDEEVPARLGDGQPAQPGQERVRPSVDLRQRLVHRLAVERPCLLVPTAGELGDDVCEERAAGRERACRRRHEHAAAPELACDRDDVQAGGAPAGDQGHLSGIDALRDRDLPDRTDDVLGGDRQRRVSGFVDTEPERTCERPLDGRVRSVCLQGQTPAQEVVGVDPPEHDGGVGDGRVAAAVAVAGWARLGACALRADAEQTAGVDPDDRAPAGADRLDVDGADPGDVPDPAPTQPVLRRVVDLAGGHEPDVEGGSTRVADDQVAVRHFRLRVRQRRDGRHGRTGADRVDRPLGHFLRTPGAAERGGDEDVTVESCMPQVLLQRLQVCLHQRLQRRVDGGRRRPPVLADDRIQLVRERERHLRPLAGEQLADAELVVRVDDRPDQAHRDCLRAQAPRVLDRGEDALLVELDEDVPLGVDALADLERQVAGHVRRRVRELPERLELPALAEQEDVREALGGEERGPGRAALDDRVRRPGRAVGEHVGACEQLADRDPELRRKLLEPVFDALERTLEVGRRLRQVERPAFVGDDHVREGASGVDGDAEAHQLSTAIRNESRSSRSVPVATS